jgi:hypothetical protein
MPQPQVISMELADSTQPLLSWAEAGHKIAARSLPNWLHSSVVYGGRGRPDYGCETISVVNNPEGLHREP